MLAWSEILDKTGSAITSHEGTWSDLITRLRSVGEYSRKEDCPWIKMATFGLKRTSKGSFRSNENMLKVYGVEADYDGEVTTIEQAQAMLEQHGIRAAIYPSPSNTSQAPRWRVLCPLAGSCGPANRATFVGRLNGALGGKREPRRRTG